MEQSDKKRVLMICLGNICRSPIAEAVFQKFIEERGLQGKWEVDSAALIGYHTGKNPDLRALSTLQKFGIKNYYHKARPVKLVDFDSFDWIFGMDQDNMENLKQMKPASCHAKVELLGKYDPNNETLIRDPYYDSNTQGFEKVYEQCCRSISSFLEKENK